MRRAVVIALVLTGCGGANPSPTPPPVPSREAAPVPGEDEVRAAAQSYLDALARGDGEAACRLLAPSVIADTGDFQSRTQCERELSDAQELGEFPILEVRMSSPNEGTAIIDGGPGSDTGYEQLPAKRYGDRWLLEGS